MNANAQTVVEKPAYLYQLWGEKNDAFFRRIDEYGGWPVGMRYVSFFHEGPVSQIPGRRCEFGNQYLRDGWWTTICEADDYYRWKLSAEALRKIQNEGWQKAVRVLGGWGGNMP
jgi:hypothetical protein